MNRKLGDVSELSVLVADKVEVRNYVTNMVGNALLIPSLGVYSNADEIEWQGLPEKFIIKTNHGSGWNLICKDLKQFDTRGARRQLNCWLRMNAYHLSREKHYKTIIPKIIIERLISFDPIDYKFFCYKSKVKIIQVDVDRNSNHRRSFFDTQWNELPINIRYNRIEKSISVPSNLDKMIEICEALSSEFEFARIDLYSEANEIYFGEITLYPGGASEPFFNFEQDKLFYDTVIV